MAPRDAMEFINEQDATLRRFVERLEARGNNPVFTGYRDAYLAGIAPGAEVLEIGCGTGVVARALAGRDGFAGRVMAVDQSPMLLDAGRRLAADEGVEVEFVQGDAHALGLPDARFDVVIAHTLITPEHRGGAGHGRLGVLLRCSQQPVFRALSSVRRRGRRRRGPGTRRTRGPRPSCTGRSRGRWLRRRWGTSGRSFQRATV